METRGQEKYINMSSFAARLYDKLSESNGMKKGFAKIARLVAVKMTEGRLLDVSSGPGRLLLEMKEHAPQLELHGLDISKAMLKIAWKRLSTDVLLKQGNIIKTDYPSDYFDCIVSSGSFYNWDNPVEALNEIYRILKPGQTAYIYETTKEYDPEILNVNLQENLVNAGLLRWFLSPLFLKKQLKMTYTVSEFRKIVMQSDFKNSYTLERDVLGGLPIYVRIELLK